GHKTFLCQPRQRQFGHFFRQNKCWPVNIIVNRILYCTEKKKNIRHDFSNLPSLAQQFELGDFLVDMFDSLSDSKKWIQRPRIILIETQFRGELKTLARLRVPWLIQFYLTSRFCTRLRPLKAERR